MNVMASSDLIQQVTRIAGSPDAPRQVAPILYAASISPT